MGEGRMIWSEAWTARLLEIRKSGLSQSSVADKLTREGFQVSNASVHNRLAEVGDPLKAVAAAVPADLLPPPMTLESRAAALQLPAIFVMPELPDLPDRPPRPPSPKIKFPDNARACIFPIGDPGAPDFRFCAEPKRDQEGPYCGHHYTVTHAPPAVYLVPAAP